jgi:hypothetical protein
MKNPVNYLFLMFLTIALASCKKEFPKDPLSISGLSVSACKTKGENIKGPDPEYINVKTVSTYYLLFNHINSIFNCEPGVINVSIQISTNTITIIESSTKDNANCICAYDIEFKLGPLEYGTYSLFFQKAGLTFKEYSLIYNKSTNVRINI